MYKNLDNLFFNLGKSKFRSSFYLNDDLKNMYKKKEWILLNLMLMILLIKN